MSNNVDRRIVEMQFDNKQFESHAQTSIETLDKLKKSLDLKDSAKGFSELDKAAKSVNLDSLVGAAEAVSSKFSIMGTVADQVFRRITDAALNAAAKAKGFVESLTIEPISTGFDEYETLINSIQTIMSNTRDKMTAAGYSEEERLAIVNDRLDELNHYADKTIYNFTQMTRNIGTFTAAGVELDTAVNSIQGIANLAAVSGSTSEQASRGMYQLSQAISTGTVRLMDWNSVVNAGMGGELFQKALERTANAMGVTVDATVKEVNFKGKTITKSVKRTASECIEAAGSFRDSLSSGWLTDDVLTATLTQLSWDFEEEAKEMGYTAANIEEGIAAAMEKHRTELLSQGYTIDDAEAILALAKDATEAATKVKTFTQLFDTLKEAAQSGWMQTWQYIIGDFNEAKELLTSISDFFGDVIGESANARNAIMAQWKDAGGRDELITSFWNIVYAIQNIVGIVRGEFEKFFPKTTSEQLNALTTKFREFTDRLRAFTENAQAMDKLRRIVAGVAAALDMARKAVSWMWRGLMKLLGVTAPVGSGLAEIAATLGDFIVHVHDSIGQSTLLQGVFAGIAQAAATLKSVLGRAFTAVAATLSGLWARLRESDLLTRLGGRVTAFAKTIPTLLKTVRDWAAGVWEYVKSSQLLSGAWNAIKNTFGSAAGKISAFAARIQQALKAFFSADTSGISGVWDKLKLRLSAAFATFSDWFERAKEALLAAWEKAKHVFGDFFTQTLPGFFGGLTDKAGKAVESLGQVDWGTMITKLIGGLVKAFAAIKALSFLSSFSKIGNGIRDIGEGIRDIGKSAKKMGRESIGTTLLKIAASIGILVASMLVLSRMDTGAVVKSLLVIGALGAELAVIAGIFKTGAADGKAFLKMAAAITLMIIPIKLLAGMDTADALKGILGIGLIMAEMALFARFAGDGLNGKKAFLSLAVGVNLLVIAVKQLSRMDTGGLAKGITALGAIFLELVLFTRMAGNAKVKGLISMALAMNLIAIAVKSLGKMSVGSLAKGVLAIGSMIAAFTVLAKTAGGTSFGKTILLLLTIAGTLVLFVDAFKKVSGLNMGSMLSFSASLSAVLLSLAISMKLLGKMPISGALTGVANLAIVIAGIGAIIIGLGALKDSWAGMTGLLEGGGEVLRLIGNAIGQFIGGIGSGVVEGLDLPGVGTQLSQFKTNAQGFIDGAGKVGSNVKTGVGNLAAALISIAGAEVIMSLSRMLTFFGANPVEQFAMDLVILGRGLAGFATSVSGVKNFDESKVTALTGVAQSLATMEKNLEAQGGVADLFAGVKSLSKFSEGFSPLVKTSTNLLTKSIR